MVGGAGGPGEGVAGGVREGESGNVRDALGLAG